MAYFIVFQNKTYQEEMNGGYLWAPKRTSSGKEIFHWSNMTKVNEGDIIFSMYKRNLVSVNIAKSKSIDTNRPAALDNVNLWEKEGWLINAEYNVLEIPIPINDCIDEVLKLSPSKYSPFTTSGRGSQGYLFEIGKKLGDYLLNIALNKNQVNIRYISKKEKKYIEDINELINTFIDETEKERVTKVRVGQGLFKDNLLADSCQCSICGLSIKELLIASHCKPWKKCSDKERLDVNNGMLLCPTHDALFDRGLITFHDNGSIIISQRLESTQFNLLNINESIKIHLRGEQIPYIQWHREQEFK